MSTVRGGPSTLTEDTYDADNSRRYAADTAKTKAEADKEVGGGDAKVSD